MKFFCLFTSFFLLQNLVAGNPYHTYLLNQAQPNFKSTIQASSVKQPIPHIIPHYQIPKGAVFCRMEDKLTKATGIWIKIGVR